MPAASAFLRSAILLVLAATTPLANAKKVKSPEQVLYLFTGESDGGAPGSGVVADLAGNLYGTTTQGGDQTCRCGVVYKLAPDGTETVLHAFTGGSADGEYPVDGVVLDPQGNLYGVTAAGGTGCAHNSGCGSVFKIAPDGTQTILHFFSDSDGADPIAGLIIDGQGNLYGTTAGGGSNGDGVVFEVAAGGTETVLHNFDDTDGQLADARLVMDSSGNLYGTTTQGGNNAGCADCGVVFKLAPDGTDTTLHSFGGIGNGDGKNPTSGLVLDANGNLYGTTVYGGDAGCGAGGGCGVVYRIAPDGSETILYEFLGAPDGAFPWGGLVMDQSGNLFGATTFGGVNLCKKGGTCGTIFELTPDGTESILFDFSQKKHGGLEPFYSLLEDQEGNLYGTTRYGGDKNQGVVFKFTP